MKDSLPKKAGNTWNPKWRILRDILTCGCFSVYTTDRARGKWERLFLVSVWLQLDFRSAYMQYQQSVSVGLHLKLSEFQVALRASERSVTPISVYAFRLHGRNHSTLTRKYPHCFGKIALMTSKLGHILWELKREYRFRAREDGERETNALRLYVGNVETSAAGLVSRIQDLEHHLALCMSLVPFHWTNSRLSICYNNIEELSSLSLQGNP